MQIIQRQGWEMFERLLEKDDPDLADLERQPISGDRSVSGTDLQTTINIENKRCANYLFHLPLGPIGPLESWLVFGPPMALSTSPWM